MKHVVLLKFKNDASQEQIDQAFDQILDLTETVDGVEDYVCGANCSAEGLDKGFTHGLVMSFHDSAARDAYLGHPDHEKIKAMIMPLVEDVMVVDFEL